MILDAEEMRVLGCLLEKEITTPEYYPLTANALVNACNQKSNRDPVMHLSEDDVINALDRLRHKGLSFIQTGAGMRVPKYGHRIPEALNLGRRELALMCELMLRGPQTLGELRARSERMHRFDDLDEVERCLRGLMTREPEPLVTRLDRWPGSKEPRYAQLLSGEPAQPSSQQTSEAAPNPRTDRIAALETEVADLRARLEALEAQIRDLLS
ncbi:MAG TPA: YceH family protein [Bryobacteraceae bacterium]|jgi:uncharacterized protein YceH (UPF0502 family)|nr:YceH family protein [Bryobacteraceae bacterium]